MLEKRTNPKGVKETKFMFYWMEPQAHFTGPSGWLNAKLADMEKDLDAAGAKRPYGIRFGGGDGKVSPMWLLMFEAKL